MAREDDDAAALAEFHEACGFGSDPERIKRLLAEHDFSDAELERAIEVIPAGVSASVESLQARQSIQYITAVLADRRSRDTASRSSSPDPARRTYQQPESLAQQEPPPGEPDERHLRCSICSRLQDGETVTEYVHPDPDLDDPSQQLVRVPNRGLSYLKRCPECGTYYRLHHLCYEFLIGFGGSYDEYCLERLTDEAAAKELTPDGPGSRPDAE